MPVKPLVSVTTNDTLRLPSPIVVVENCTRLNALRKAARLPEPALAVIVSTLPVKVDVKPATGWRATARRHPRVGDRHLGPNQAIVFNIAEGEPRIDDERRTPVTYVGVPAVVVTTGASSTGVTFNLRRRLSVEALKLAVTVMNRPPAVGFCELFWHATERSTAC